MQSYSKEEQKCSFSLTMENKIKYSSNVEEMNEVSVLHVEMRKVWFSVWVFDVVWQIESCCPYTVSSL